MQILAKIKNFVKINKEKIFLTIIIFLISLFSFAIGYLVSEYSKKTPLTIEKIELLR
ncbi:MAG: hypothetical protein ACP5H7_00480 [Minisyncoccia bacterium]